MTDAFIYDAARTPRGKGRKDGKLHEITPIQLATQVLQAIRENEFRAEALGYRTVVYRIWANCLAALVADGFRHVAEGEIS